MEQREDVEVLRLKFSFGFVCHGPLRDYTRIKELIARELPETRLIYSLPSTRPLFLIKGEVKRDERKERVE